MTAERVERVAAQPPGERPVERVGEPRIGDERGQRRRRFIGPPLGEVGAGQRHHRARKAGLARQHLAGEAAAPRPRRRPAGPEPPARSERRDCADRPPSPPRNRAAPRRAGPARSAPCRDWRAPARTADRAPAPRHNPQPPPRSSPSRLAGEPDRVQYPDRLGRRGFGALEQRQRLGGPALLLAAPGDQAQHHDMVDAVGERVLGEPGRRRHVALRSARRARP